MSAVKAALSGSIQESMNRCGTFQVKRIVLASDLCGVKRDPSRTVKREYGLNCSGQDY